MDNKINTLLIGLGRIGYLSDKDGDCLGVTHFSSLNNNPNFNLKAVCDTDELFAGKIFNETGVKSYRHIEMLPADLAFDLVVVATPDHTHFDIVKKAMLLNPKLIFVEKPLTPLSSTSKEILKLAKRNKVELLTNYSRRFNDFYILLRERIRKDKDSPKKIIFKFTGSIRHNGVHFIDLALFLFGTPDKISKVDDRTGPSRLFDFWYKEFNARVYFIALGEIGASIEETDIFYGNNRIQLNGKKVIKSSIIDDPVFFGFKAFGNEKILSDDGSKSLQNAYEQIYDWFLGGKKLLSPADESIKIFKIIEENLYE